MVDLIKKTKVGTKKSDRLSYGTVQNSKISLGWGNDRLTINRVEASTISGGTGNDQITIGYATNSLFNLGSGNDVLVWNAESREVGPNNIIDGGQGFDTLKVFTTGFRVEYNSDTSWSVSVAGDSGLFVSTLKSIEKIILNENASSREGVQYSLTNATQSRAAQITITGTSTKDSIFFTDNEIDVTVNSGAGDDSIEASLVGQATIDGGLGTDDVYFQESRVAGIALDKDGTWLFKGNPPRNAVTRLVNVESAAVGNTIYELTNLGATIYSRSVVNVGSVLRGTGANDLFLVGQNDQIDMLSGGADTLIFKAKRFLEGTKSSQSGIIGFKKDDSLNFSDFPSASTQSDKRSYDPNSGLASGSMIVKLTNSLTLNLTFTPF